MTEIPTVHVELIEEKPDSFGEWANAHPGVDLMRDGGLHGLSEGQQDLLTSAYRDYLARFQPFRWNAKAANNEIVGRGERYFNEADAEHAVRLQYGSESSVVMRRPGQPDEQIRQGVVPGHQTLKVQFVLEAVMCDHCDTYFGLPLRFDNLPFTCPLGHKNNPRPFNAEGAEPK